MTWQLLSAQKFANPVAKSGMNAETAVLSYEPLLGLRNKEGGERVGGKNRGGRK